MSLLGGAIKSNSGNRPIAVLKIIKERIMTSKPVVINIQTIIDTIKTTDTNVCASSLSWNFIGL
jgi:hypothetical protein